MASALPQNRCKHSRSCFTAMSDMDSPSKTDLERAVGVFQLPSIILSAYHHRTTMKYDKNSPKSHAVTSMQNRRTHSMTHTVMTPESERAQKADLERWLEDLDNHYRSEDECMPLMV
mmetsp:Transcript_21372/g.46414  ORF Transcript_21372/g.46414 Transcript_21372/m.46414 type:complete len:117 (-) Transcript_21372:32-382(-)